MPEIPILTPLLETLLRIASESVHLLYLAAPFLLLGLLMAGFVHVLLPQRTVEKYLGRPGLGGAAMAAAIGIPLPVCSCGVVPLAVEMRRKNASDPASLSFLVTTPESGIDSILFTWGLMGPVMAIFRPIAAFGTAMLGAGLALIRPTRVDAPAPENMADVQSSCCGGGCASTTSGAVLAETVAIETVAIETVAAETGLEEAGLAETDTQRVDGHSHGVAGGAMGTGSFGAAKRQGVVRPALRYGFGELFDDIAFWLLLGIVLGGVLTAFLPADLASLGLGEGIVPMLLMLAVGIPLYMCASASTPVAAALLAKGLSPGAALVFLLAGPATNAASLVVLGRTFGRRFIQTYLVAVAVGALLSGLALDALIGVFAWQILVPSSEAHAHGLELLPAAAFAVLVALLIRSGFRGALGSGLREMMEGFRGSFRALGRQT